MDNVMLGKAVKAMYKLSGKTLGELAEKSGLTLDTINNLFYARLQKPGFKGVCELVEAAGYSVADLAGFLAQAESFPAGTDYTDAFAKYIISAEDTKSYAEPTNDTVKSAKQEKAFEEYVRQLNADHEKQLERIKDMNLNYLNYFSRQFDFMKRTNLMLTIALIAVAVGAVLITFIVKM